MTSENSHWTKPQLKIYTLLLCARADHEITPDELELIKSKTDAATFNYMYDEIKDDTEDEALEKIQDNLSWHDYSTREISQLKEEVHQVFMSDNKMLVRESSLDEILDNILY